MLRLAHPLLQCYVPLSGDPTTHYWQTDLRAGVLEYGDGREPITRVGRKLFLEMVHEALGELREAGVHRIQETIVREELVLQPDSERRLQLRLTLRTGEEARVEIASRALLSAGAWTTHFTGRLRLAPTTQRATPPSDRVSVPLSPAPPALTGSEAGSTGDLP